jgi:ATP phosphoribosyltransferase
MLRIALQKSGRLSDDSVALLRDAGIRLQHGAQRLLRQPAANFPLEIIYLRDDDIPEYVEEGVVDVGIVGENVVLEQRKNIQIVDRLGFGRCRMCIAVPRDMTYQNLRDLEGRRIATTYGNVLRDCLAEAGVQADIHDISGAVEIAPSLGLADAIFDIVSTGSTLLANGLREADTLLRSEAVLVARPDLDTLQREILDRLLFRIRANRAAQSHRYLLLNAPNDRLADIIRIMPGMKSPTVIPLALAGWSSVHAVVREEVFWEVLEQLKAAGAEGILVVPIERMLPG